MPSGIIPRLINASQCIAIIHCATFLQNLTIQFLYFQLPFKTVYAYGPIGHVICTAARDQNAECIILGSRGLGTIRRTILGSVCDYVTQHMNVPVLMVPPADKC